MKRRKMICGTARFAASAAVLVLAAASPVLSVRAAGSAAAGDSSAAGADATVMASDDAVSKETDSKTSGTGSPSASGKTVTLRVCNWEEYIDEGDWDESEAIDLPDGTILGENSLVEDFQNWYYETYGVKVKVEYSTFGTNEDLYNMLTLGDTYDLICPSDYMIMKLMSEGELQPLSDHFFDASDENNFYIRGVSPYIQKVFEDTKIDGEPWAQYSAGYMWGITGFVYNPDVLTEEEASTWTLADNPAYKRQITIKDNVRDSYFMAVGALNADKLTSDSFVNDPDYHQNLEDVMNDTSPEMIAKVQDYLQNVKDNVYSFETDSGKADMITGKVVANYQWSGDAVYTMDQAEDDGYYLDFAVPRESTNIYFDGWCMLKKGIAGDADKQQAAEAFINFLSRPDSVIRNMYYIGYTSVISGGDDPRILEYLDWNYGADDGESDTTDYDLTYFFTGDTEGSDPGYVLTVPKEQLHRQLGAQYPSTDVIRRSSIMRYFTPDENSAINQMWVNVRCYNIRKVPVWGWLLMGAALAGMITLAVYQHRRKHAAG